MLSVVDAEFLKLTDLVEAVGVSGWDSEKKETAQEVISGLANAVPRVKTCDAHRIAFALVCIGASLEVSTSAPKGMYRASCFLLAAAMYLEGQPLNQSGGIQDDLDELGFIKLFR